MINKDAIEKIESMAKNEMVKINGIDYSVKNLHAIYPPKAKSFTISTLAGLVDYINSKDNVKKDDLLIHVASPTEVHLFSKLNEVTRHREELVVVDINGCKFNFGRWYDNQQFIINLQANFTETAPRNAILKLVSSIKTEATQELDDNGVSQQVVVKKGSTLKYLAEIPNPVNLAPFRTFREVDQPESTFILRLQHGRELALFEADGGEWELKAIAGIKKWLSDKIKDIPIIA